ncbi:hypothetical protein [Pseudomonas sp. QTF5]|uniref:hypothetical protein n=1 Tax=Pseudomonas sp. QTF5 TaxID=1435425 RepID=UPI0004BE2B09
MRLSRVEQVQHRTLLLSGKQTGFHGAGLALLLRQQLIFVLHDRTLHHTLNFSGQSFFLVEALGISLRCGRARGQSIQWIVVVAAKQGFAVGLHGRAP